MGSPTGLQQCPWESLPIITSKLLGGVNVAADQCMHSHLTFAYISLPGCKQSPSQRHLHIAAEDRKSLIFIFPPVDESLENESFLWGRRTSVRFYEPGLRETFARPYICFLKPLVEAGPHDLDMSWDNNKCPQMPCLWSTAHRVGFPGSIRQTEGTVKQEIITCRMVLDGFSVLGLL